MSDVSSCRSVFFSPTTNIIGLTFRQAAGLIVSDKRKKKTFWHFPFEWVKPKYKQSVCVCDHVLLLTMWCSWFQFPRSYTYDIWNSGCVLYSWMQIRIGLSGRTVILSLYSWVIPFYYYFFFINFISKTCLFRLHYNSWGLWQNNMNWLVRSQKNNLQLWWLIKHFKVIYRATFSAVRFWISFHRGFVLPSHQRASGDC